MTKDGSGVYCCDHCGDQMQTGTIYGYQNEKTGTKLYFCSGVCAGAYMAGFIGIKMVVPKMVQTYKYKRTAHTMLNYEFSAWIHPKNGGDDYRINGTMSLPKGTTNPDEEVKAEIRKILKKKRSAILDDFTFKRVN